MGDAHTSSESGAWETPPDLVTDLAPVFPWDLDAAASRPNVCKHYYSPEEDGLAQPWEGLIWLNPPYGKKRHIDWWMQKAHLEGQKDGTTVVCLPPARTSTRWWHDNVPFASLVVFFNRRVHFILPEHYETDPTDGALVRVPEKRGPAGFPSAFVVFGDLTRPQLEKLCSYGWPVFPKGYMPPVIAPAPESLYFHCEHK
jgi:phage N-6-adenine-methyltransferase